MTRREKLFWALFRHQAYLEGVKLAFAQSYYVFLKNTLLPGVQQSFGSITYNKMDQFSIGELNFFLRTLQSFQAAQYRLFEAKIKANLLLLINADDKVLGKLYEHFTDKALSSNVSEIWTAASEEPIPANGATIEEQLQKFFIGAAAALLSQVKFGYANSLTPQETYKLIVGSVDNRFTDGLFAKLYGQNKSSMATIIQHISSITQSSIASQSYDRYEWVAVLDDRTTLICRSRNGTIYIYGQGPLPPAHYNCRSKAVDWIDGEAFDIPDSYYSWLRSQPSEIQDDILGVTLAQKVRNGTINPQDLSITTTKPLTLTEFAAKIAFILEGL